MLGFAPSWDPPVADSNPSWIANAMSVGSNGFVRVMVPMLRLLGVLLVLAASILVIVSIAQRGGAATVQ